MPQKFVTLSGDAPPDPHGLTRRSPTNGKELEDSWKMALAGSKLYSCSYKIDRKSGDCSCLPREASLAKLTGCQRKLITQYYHASRNHFPFSLNSP